MRIVPGCVRSWAALVQESDQQSRLGADRWIRRNSGVLRAIDRASDTMQLVVQPSGQPVVIIRMKPATRQLSVMRAIEQMVPPGTAKPQELAGWYRWVLPTVSINDTIDLQPTVDVGTVAEAVVIVLSPSSTDSDAIKQQLGR
ncbi:MAG TPA: hypothetical protein ENJ00_08000 [Phycisphaerales bacterium]|nr:hypothetical protein [Phycisphaerales bacterium]